MRILIRTDLSAQIGMGHAVRCLALAQELAARGATVSFLSTSLALESFVKPFPCDCIAPSTHEDTFEIIQRTMADVLIVDTKEPCDDGVYSLLMKERHVVRIDHPYATAGSCDLLIGPVNHWPSGTVATLCASFGDRFLYGWDYVMLAPEITAQQPIPYAKRRQEQIMFCAGGADPENAREQMYQWVQDLDLDVPLYFPPLGNADAYRNGLRESVLVVGFIGQTMYECAWYKTPMLCFARTPEDAKALELLEEKSGGSLHAGNMFSFYTQEKFVSKVEAVWQKNVRWPPLLDGNGTKRVAGIILGF